MTMKYIHGYLSPNTCCTILTPSLTSYKCQINGKLFSMLCTYKVLMHMSYSQTCPIIRPGMTRFKPSQLVLLIRELLKCARAERRSEFLTALSASGRICISVWSRALSHFAEWLELRLKNNLQVSCEWTVTDSSLSMWLTARDSSHEHPYWRCEQNLSLIILYEPRQCLEILLEYRHSCKHLKIYIKKPIIWE